MFRKPTEMQEKLDLLETQVESVRSALQAFRDEGGRTLTRQLDDRDERLEDKLSNLDEKVRDAFLSVRATFDAHVDMIVRVEAGMLQQQQQLGAELNELRQIQQGMKSRVDLMEAEVQALQESNAVLSRAASDPQQRGALDALARTATERMGEAANRQAVLRQLRTWSERTLGILTLLGRLQQDAPVALGASLVHSSQAVAELSEELQALTQSWTDRGLPLTLRVRTPAEGSVQDSVMHGLQQIADPLHSLQLRINTLLSHDVPSVIDLCDASRRDGFPAGLEVILQELIDIAGLETIRPARGDPYDPREHVAIDLVSTDTTSLQDTIERCSYRGYRRGNELLKKAGVVIYR